MRRRLVAKVVRRLYKFSEAQKEARRWRIQTPRFGGSSLDVGFLVPSCKLFLHPCSTLTLGATPWLCRSLKSVNMAKFCIRRGLHGSAKAFDTTVYKIHNEDSVRCCKSVLRRDAKQLFIKEMRAASCCTNKIVFQLLFLIKNLAHTT